MGYSDQLFRLTEAERSYLFFHPHHAFAIQSSKETALAETTRRFGRNGRNDRSDAFRHCFWSAVLARDLGYENARKFTTAHESKPGNPIKEKEMDLHNNAQGLKIGRHGGDTVVLSQKCMSELTAGRLKAISP